MPPHGRKGTSATGCLPLPLFFKDVLDTVQGTMDSRGWLTLLWWITKHPNCELSAKGNRLSEEKCQQDSQPQRLSLCSIPNHAQATNGYYLLDREYRANSAHGDKIAFENVCAQAGTNAQARTNGSSLSRNRLGSPSLPPLHLLVRYSPIFHCKPTPFSFCKRPLCHPFSNRTPISCLDHSAFKLLQFCGT